MGEETMWAVQYAEYGGPDVLRVGTVPRPRPSREQVLVEVAAFSINGADLLARRGRLRVLSGFGFPKGTGVDFAGTIRERGADVTSLRVGDRVWGYLGVKPPGAHAAAAQYVVASTDVLAVAPDSTSLSEAAALPLVGLTALKALRDALRVAAGDRVLVVGGSGGVGSTAIQIAVALGARVDAVAGSRGDVAESAGAEHVYDYRSTAPEQISARYHVILDTSGSRVGAYRGLLTRAGRIASVFAGLLLCRHGIRRHPRPSDPGGVGRSERRGSAVAGACRRRRFDPADRRRVVPPQPGRGRPPGQRVRPFGRQARRDRVLIGSVGDFSGYVPRQSDRNRPQTSYAGQASAIA